MGARLVQVHRGLGQMQARRGRGDLKKVLTNVHIRAIWGEVQLGALLEQVLRSDQYAANVSQTSEGREIVEFAVKFPGRGESGAMWLPIDSKFLMEDYLWLLEAHEIADREVLEEAAKALEARLRLSIKEITTSNASPHGNLNLRTGPTEHQEHARWRPALVGTH